MIPAHSKLGHEMRMQFERLVSWYGRKQSIPVYIEDNILKSTEINTPNELEQHLAMNCARLITYEQVRSEIQAYIEARRSQFALNTVATKRTSCPMEVESFGTGGKKGKRERHVLNGKVPQHTPFHFLWVSSKILFLAESF